MGPFDVNRGTIAAVAGALLASALGAAPVPAQEEAAREDAPAAVLVEDAPVCTAGVIHHIFVDNHSIFDTSDPDLDDRFRWAYSLANRLHVRTRESVIGRELLFGVGDCFDPVLLEESERLLRGYPFIARVDIYGIQQPGGGYHVIVDTEDEWSTRLEAKADLSGTFELEAVELREQNVLGTGQELGLFYRAVDATRSYGLRYRTPQLFRTRWDAALSAGRTRAGSLFYQEVSYPFLGEIGKWGFRQTLYRQDRLFDYILPDAPEEPTRRVLVPLRESGLQVAGLRRFGERGNLTVLGGGISYTELSFPGEDSTEVTLVENGGYEERQPAPADLVAEVAPFMAPFRNIRAVLLVGKRNITWRQRRGLDSFRGEQDIRLGAEVELAFARSLPGLESDNDLYGSMDVYAAAGPPTSFLAMRLRVDARRDYDADPGQQHEMQDVFAEGELFAYLRPSFLPRHTLVLRAAGAGGWYVETPFQVTLGGESALRGWREDALPGGRRTVFTAEDRWYIGWPFPGVADVGTSLFADVGRIWPGEAPFGVDSGWRTSVGAGLRVNFPARGTNTFRLDIAAPVTQGGLGRPQLLIGLGEYIGVTAPFSDPQFGRSRMPPITGNLLHFPN